MVREVSIYQCTCAACQAGEHPEQDDHRHLNLILSRLDEQQRRWVAGREALRRGHGAIRQIAEITGLHPETIGRGGEELARDLQDRPTDRVRLPRGSSARGKKDPALEEDLVRLVVPETAGNPCQ